MTMQTDRHNCTIGWLHLAHVQRRTKALFSSSTLRKDYSYVVKSCPNILVICWTL